VRATGTDRLFDLHLLRIASKVEVRGRGTRLRLALLGHARASVAKGVYVSRGTRVQLGSKLSETQRN
jgi:hypothetical protein